MIRNNLKISGNNILSIGSDCFINSDMLFDLSADINIGNNVVIGGRGTEFWTHSYTLDRKITTSEISIGNNIYFGSGCLVNKGVSIASNNTIGAKTVVSKIVDTENNIVVSNKQVSITRKINTDEKTT